MSGNADSLKDAAILSGMPAPRRVDVDGIETVYYETGCGAPIVFIYGGNFGSADSASSAYTWNLNISGLSRRFRAIAFDKVGQGFTANPRDDDYTMKAVVAHAASFIGALDLEPVHLVGHSRGGFAATRLTLEYPDLVRTLTIVTSGTLIPSVSTNEAALGGPPHPPFTREGARWIYDHYCYRREAVTEEWMDAVMAIFAQPKYRESVRKMEEDGLKASSFLPALAQMKLETLTWLAQGRLQRPTHIVWGQNDPTTSVEGGIDLFRTIAAHERRTSLNIINHAGHFPFREHPERFNELLAGFVSLYAH